MFSEAGGEAIGITLGGNNKDALLPQKSSAPFKLPGISKEDFSRTVTAPEDFQKICWVLPLAW